MSTWLYSPQKDYNWNDCKEGNFISLSINYDQNPSSLSMLQLETIIKSNGEKNFREEASLAYSFMHDIKAGDVVYVRRGRTTIIGKGTVQGNYSFQPNETFPHTIPVKWIPSDEFAGDLGIFFDIMPMNFLTNISDHKNLKERLNNLPLKSEENGNFWFLAINPKERSFDSWRIGGKYELSTTSENNNQPRPVNDNFNEVKIGDRVICYEINPTLQILGLAYIYKPCDDEKITFEKIEDLECPIDISNIKDNIDTQEIEFFSYNRSGLYKLKKEEYFALMQIIREVNPIKDSIFNKSYTKEQFLSEVFVSEKQLDGLTSLLKDKKNIILQGAPGVGKTFCAKRLAYEMMQQKDESRICVVQFHQNYSYEDFVMGYKPTQDGFSLQPGIFYRFCKKAINNSEQDYFFIIDEINRGNLSKIFGELLMLIEKSYRGVSLSLAYKGEQFYVPDNLYIIGMMNTADRSLAFIDYALRRRFSFVSILPGFDSNGFKAYLVSLNNSKLNKLINLIKVLNEEIRKDTSLGEGFEIGHSYFCEKKTIDDNWLHQIIDHDIIPILNEYWFDDKEKVITWKNKMNDIF